MNSIYQAYLKSEKSVQTFFNYPLKPDWREISKQVLNRQQPFLLEELIAQNGSCVFPAQKKNLEKLKQKNVLLVVTGQQLGLFVSPLYTIFKALTAVVLSEKLNEQNTEFTYVPVFWLEGEDHDFAEVNHAFVFNRQNNLHRIEIKDSNPARLPVGQRSLPKFVPEMLTELKEILQPTEFSPALFEQLEKIYRPGQNWLEVFKTHLQQVLGHWGLLFFNPGEPTVKQKSLPFFRKVVEQNDDLLKALAEQTVQIKKPQVPLQPDRAYLFFLLEGKIRQPVLRLAAGKFKVYGEEQIFSKDDFIQRIKQNPHRISSGVLTRPLWQSFMLPVVSYVAGPGEIAYWAQLKKAFQTFDLVMPHLQPRFSATLIEPRVQRLLNKFHLHPRQVTTDFNTWSASALKNLQLKELQGEVDRFKKYLQQSRQQFVRLSCDIDPTLGAVVTKSFKNMENTLQKMSGRLEKAWRQKNEVTMEQLRTIQENLFPLGKAQERILSPIYFFNKFGQSWLQKVIDAIDLQNTEHQYLQL